MREVQVTLPELVLLVGTRAALGTRGRSIAGGLPAREPTQGRRVDTTPGRREHDRPSRGRGAREGPRLAPVRVATKIRVTKGSAHT